MHHDHDGGDSRPMLDRRSLVALAAAAPMLLGALPLALARATEGGYQASDATNAALADAQGRYDQAVAQLNELNNAVYDAEAAYEQTSADLEQTTAQISDLQGQIDQTQAELDEVRDTLAERMGADYRAGKNSTLDMVLSATSFEDFVNRIFVANKVYESDAQIIDQVAQLQDQLQTEQVQLQEQQAQQAQLQQDQAARLDDLNAQVASTEDYVAGLDGEVRSLMAQQQAEIEAQAEAARQAAAQQAQAQAEQLAATGETVQVYQPDTSGGGSADAWSGGSSDGGSSGGGTGYQPTNVVSAAYSYLGTSYSVLDCSGLTSRAYADCGYSIIHQSGSQYNTVVAAGNLTWDVGSLVPGNLVFYSRGGSIYHVAMYVGDGMVIESIPSEGVSVHAYNFCDGFCGGGSPF